MPFSPDVVLLSSMGATEIWLEVSSNDTQGCTIDGVNAGDLIQIIDASGVASFAVGKTPPFVSGIASIMSAVVIDGINYVFQDAAKETEQAFREQRDILRASFMGVTGDKRRDAYGKDPNSGDYGKHEGGIIICMPESHGAVYASVDCRFKDEAKKRGRLPDYYGEGIKKKQAWFPSTEGGGIMEKVAAEAGTIRILAFDQKFTDNAGAYAVKLIISRHQEARTKLLQMRKL